ncbi:hypothetical protein [Janthinobacterium sp. AD80]|uniref:hypothetical protein n=1 Tax=Janthinobacterium sp. AD80 TaxID=1528773 RepID=UPI000C84DE74|nr:hypothetical protein [Janthinobacterium sp. AD80]
MDDRSILKAQEPLLVALEKVSSRLSAIALLGLAEEFYEKETRIELYRKYQELRNTCLQKYEEMAAFGLQSDGMSQEDADSAYSKANEAERRAEFTRLKDIKVVADNELREFEKEHRILVRLLETKGELSKGKYDK